MEIYETIKSLCKKHKTSISKLEKELKLGNGTIRNWDKNSPSIDKVEKVADYFGVSLDSLRGREILNNPKAVELIADDLFPILFNELKNMDLPQELKDAAIAKFSVLPSNKKLELVPKLVKSAHVAEKTVKYELETSGAPTAEEIIAQYNSLPAEHRKAIGDLIKVLSSH